ncbi:uncharacterized protein CDV56_107391 [Aspergillus thermomutatus]|uniref:Uncharacterized protein n=1 Tax=Aspergillus thermomutatus TaxID=41047 RepID=A0A397H4B3_ASPTH|nr:uncharacterized protein CDV56_107391 [Aspergillus thermomutatus]RHZ55230.1 hypothetical protein CDV56_107391 [Aspergillus thermomutatus]
MCTDHGWRTAYSSIGSLIRSTAPAPVLTSLALRLCDRSTNHRSWWAHALGPPDVLVASRVSLARAPCPTVNGQSDMGLARGKSVPVAQRGVLCAVVWWSVPSGRKP